MCYYQLNDTYGCLYSKGILSMNILILMEKYVLKLFIIYIWTCVTLLGLSASWQRQDNEMKTDNL